MKKMLLACLIIAIVASGCATVIEKMPEKTQNENNSFEKATFAGGCFWCIEASFEEVEGVIKAVSGYTGGEKENPSYEEVLTGTTGHKESVEITFDPEKVSYKELIELFWRQINPTDDIGQFSDKGSQYRTAIFYHNETQKKIAEESKKELDESGKFDKPIVTEILPAEKFYPAEEYHQDYSKKRTVRYNIYKKGSGREGYLKETWENE